MFKARDNLLSEKEKPQTIQEASKILKPRT